MHFYYSAFSLFWAGELPNSFKLNVPAIKGVDLGSSWKLDLKITEAYLMSDLIDQMITNMKDLIYSSWKLMRLY